MVRIPTAYHGIAARPSNLIAKVAHILKWFNTHGESKPLILTMKRRPRARRDWHREGPACPVAAGA